MSLNPDCFTLLPRGLKAGVLHMSGQDLIHQSVLGDVLCSVIEHEAKAHNALFLADQFNKIIEAVKEGKISAYFLLAGWENCRPKIAGGSIEFPTVITKWEGNEFKHYPAIYGEDTCILSKALRELVRERPEGKNFPENIGLAEYFEQERIRRWTSNEFGDAPLGMAARGRVGEYSAHSKAMKKVMSRFGGTLGEEQDGTILEINGLTQAMKDKWKLPVETGGLTAENGASSPNIFLTRWSGEDGRQQLCASFTNGISSFTGDPIVRVQITGNGNLPNAGILQSALASLLAAGQEEIQARHWGSSKEQRAKSPVIPLHGSQQEIYAALSEASQDEMFVRRLGRVDLSPIFGGSVPTMRIHAIQEPGIVSALQAMDAQTRMLGPHPMLPVVMDFANAPKESLYFRPTPARPLNIVRPLEAASAPIFAIAV